MNEPPHTIKTCPHCKTTFTCIQTLGCWCDQVNTTPEQLKILRETYTGCLCKSCLQAFAEGNLIGEE